MGKNIRGYYALVSAFIFAIAGLFVASTATGSASAAASAVVKTYVQPPWKMVAYDAFSGTSLNTSKWEAMYGVPGCCAQTVWDPRMVKVGGGYLHLQNRPVNGVWKSGGVGSWGWGAGNMLYGRVDARIRFDAGRSVSAAALLWPDQNRSWPPEVDFYEIGRQVADRSSVMITNHYKATSPADRVGEHMMTQAFAHADFTQWHTVSTRWMPRRLVILVDGKIVFDEKDVSKIPAIPMWIGLQTHVEPINGAWPSLPAGKTSIDLDVDWVRIYQR